MTTAPEMATRPLPTPVAPLGWLALVAVGLGPMLVKLGQSLWDREQYQFFPIVLAGAAAVAWERWRDGPPRRTRGSPAVTAVLLAAALLALVTSTLLWVRSLSLVATLFVGAAVAWHVGGRRLLRTMAAPLLLLAVLVPPPGHAEQGVTLRLQHLAVAVSGQLLDALRVPNAQAGNVIEVPGRRLLIEQACSGINSLMAVLAVTLLYGFYYRRSVWRLALLLPAAVAFVVGGNVVRITTESALLVRHNVDLTAGTAHALLGLGLFLACAALVVSLDALLGGGGGPLPPSRPLRYSEEPGRPPPFPRPAWLVALAFAGVGLWTATRVWPAWRSSALPPTATFDLPPTLAGWDRVTAGAAVVERPQTEAAKSFVWQYRRGDAFASVAVDYPFVGYHELVTCYAVSGWAIRSESADDAAHVTRVAMDKRAGGTGATCGTLRFAQADEAGRVVTKQTPDVGDTAWTRLRFALAYARQTATAGPSYQVQTLVQTPGPPSPDQQRAADDLFAAARAQLVAQLIAQLEKTQ